MTNEVPRTRSVLLYYFSGTGNSRRLAEVWQKYPLKDLKNQDLRLK